MVPQPIRNKELGSGRELGNTVSYIPCSSVRQWKLWGRQELAGITYRVKVKSPTEKPGVWTPGGLSAILLRCLLKNACHYHQCPTDQVDERISSEWFLNNKCLHFLLAPGQIPPLNLIFKVEHSLRVSDLALIGLLMSLSIHKPPFQGLFAAKTIILFWVWIY